LMISRRRRRELATGEEIGDLFGIEMDLAL
jgi:hypothetical protein